MEWVVAARAHEVLVHVGKNRSGNQIFENERVRVWEFTLQPGESIGAHRHDHDFFFYPIEGGMLQRSVPVLQRWGGVREAPEQVPLSEKMRSGEREGGVVWRGVQGGTEEEGRGGLLQIPSDEEVQLAREVRVMMMMMLRDRSLMFWLFWFSSLI